MAFDRTIISIFFLIQGIFAAYNAVTDGAEYIRKLFDKENVKIEKPEYLLFTAPYRICQNGCTGSDRRINFGMAFPLFLGNYGKKLYKQLYPNDDRKPGHLFTTRSTRGSFTTCIPKKTHKPSTKSTMYPEYVVNTKSTGFPGYEIRKTRSTGYNGQSEVAGTRSTAYHGYSEVTGTRSTGSHNYRETRSTWVPDIEDYKSTRRANFLRYKPFLTRTRHRVYPEYAEFKYTREIDVLRNKPPRKNSIPESYNQAKNDEADYSLKSEQEYTYRNSITPNSRDSHSKKMRWLKMSMIRKTINNMIPSKPSLMRRLAPFRRQPKYHQDSINANVEVRKPNEQPPFGFMPVLPIH